MSLAGEPGLRCVAVHSPEGQWPFALTGRAFAIAAAREEGLRIGILDLCETLEIPIPADQRRALEEMHAAELDALRLELRQQKRWPRSSRART